MQMKNFSPVIIEKGKDGERIYDVYSRLIKDRIIYLDCEIDHEVASQVTSMFYLLNREDNEKEIQFWLSSPGGSVAGFFAIYDMMHWIEAPIATVAVGEVSSAASALLAAGTPGKRFVMPNSRVMIHQIQLDGISGSNSEVEITTKEIKKIQEKFTEILARHSGHTKKKIKRDTSFDRYFSAQGAIEYGLADKQINIKKPIPELLTREKIKTTDADE